MSALRNQILHEVAELDIKSLQALQPILTALKRKSGSTTHQKRGVSAARCRQTLSNLKGSLSQIIIEEREERL